MVLRVLFGRGAAAGKFVGVAGQRKIPLLGEDMGRPGSDPVILA